MTGDSRWRLIWPLLVALVVRLACLPLGGLIVPSGDAMGYVYLAQSFRSTGQFDELALGVRPPLLRVLLAPGVDLSTTPPGVFPGAYLIQMGMDLLALALLMQVAYRRFGARAATATGWLYALLPQAVLFSSSVIMAETITVLAVAAALQALDALDRALDRTHDDGTPEGAGTSLTHVARRCVLLGAVLGLGILSRELLVPVALMFLLALLLRRGTRLAHRLALAAATCLVALAVTAPWLAWTNEQYGVPILSGTYGAISMGLDNTPPGQSSRRFYKEYHDLDTQSRLSHARQTFMAALIDYPGLTAERAWGRLRIAAGPEDALPIWIALTFDGFVPDASSNVALARQAWVLPDGWGRVVQILCGAASVVLLALGAAGLCAAPRSALTTVTLLALCAILGTMALTVASARYRFALVPFLLPFAGHAASMLGELRSGLQTQQHGARRAAICGLAVAVLLTVTVFVLPAP